MARWRVCGSTAGMPPARAGGGRRLRPRRAVSRTPTSTCWCCCPTAPTHRRGRAAEGDAVEAFVTACWDIGLEIGSSVRTVDECVARSARDVTVQTALLESRLVCGARGALHQQFRSAPARRWTPRLPARQDAGDAPAPRQVRGTPYALEPNCKESPGGLRDLQVVIWVARAAGPGPHLGELAAKGLITPFEASQLRKHEGTLKLIRAACTGGRAPRGPAGVRPADRRGRELRLQGAPRGAARSEC
jgi:hypothetical protein